MSLWYQLLMSCWCVPTGTRRFLWRQTVGRFRSEEVRGLLLLCFKFCVLLGICCLRAWHTRFWTSSAGGVPAGRQRQAPDMRVADMTHGCEFPFCVRSRCTGQQSRGMPRCQSRWRVPRPRATSWHRYISPASMQSCIPTLTIRIRYEVLRCCRRALDTFISAAGVSERFCWWCSGWPWQRSSTTPGCAS